MTYRGGVENGKVILAGAVTLPEGTEVEVAVCRQAGASAQGTEASAANEPSRPSIEEKIARIMGDVPESDWEALPADLNDHLDHYVYSVLKS